VTTLAGVELVDMHGNRLAPEFAIHLLCQGLKDAGWLPEEIDAARSEYEIELASDVQKGFPCWRGYSIQKG